MKSRKLLSKALATKPLRDLTLLHYFVKFSTLRNGVYGKGQILNLYFSLLMPRFKELAETETFLAFLWRNSQPCPVHLQCIFLSVLVYIILGKADWVTECLNLELATRGANGTGIIFESFRKIRKLNNFRNTNHSNENFGYSERKIKSDGNSW